MKSTVKILFSIFFFIAIIFHVYQIIIGDLQPLWWHSLYIITYAGCWLMIFSSNKKRSLIYLVMGLFPFISHAYYAYKSIPKFGGDFWVCCLVCIMIPLGFIWLQYSEKKNLN